MGQVFYTHSGSRNNHFMDLEGVVSWFKDKDSTESYTVHFDDFFPALTNDSTITTTVSGVTLVGTSDALPASYTVTVKGVGEVKLTITVDPEDDNSEVIIKRLRFVERVA